MFGQPSSQIFDTSFDLDKLLMARDAASQAACPIAMLIIISVCNEVTIVLAV